jgi:hypothetical protein
MDRIELTGNVVMKSFGKGSKSEHNAVFLDSDKGSYKLRRTGGNPFRDPELDQLVGKQITAKGTINEYVFIIDQFEVIG